MQNIDLYYESLKEVYDEMADWKPPEELKRNRVMGAIVGFLVVFLLLSIVPIIPLIVTYVGARFNWTIAGMTVSFSVGNFALLWLAEVVIAVLLLAPIVWINNKLEAKNSARRKERPPQTLSAEQIAFICAYESYKELKIFFVSHIDQHVDQSLRALARILPDDQDTFYRWDGSEAVGFDIGGPTTFVAPYSGPRDLRHYVTYYPFLGRMAPSLPRQIFIARSFLRTFDQLGWFRLEPRTKSILQAFISLKEKLPYRLQEREDLPAVLSVLQNLSQLIYAYLPEHKTYMQEGELSSLQAEGAVCLDQFIEQLNALTLAPRREDTNVESKRSPTWREKYRYYHTNSVFFRFTEWFILILVLTSGAFFAINFFVKLSPDTIATVIIGTSVASAAALAGFLPTRASVPKSTKRVRKKRKD